MKICDVLADSIRAELNHLYTERPFQTPDGGDLGWFCREHALHVAALGEMLGGRSRLCCGDVVIEIPGDITISTVGSGSDHAWCRVDDTVPVDASLTIRFLSTTRRDVHVVCPDCPEHLAGFELRYRISCTDDNAFMRLARTGEPVIAYNQKKQFRTGYENLLSNPFTFLNPPPPNCRTFQQIHGPDVYFAITAHIYALAIGESEPLRPHYDPVSAVRAIVARYPDARMKVGALLHAKRAH